MRNWSEVVIATCLLVGVASLLSCSTIERTALNVPTVPDAAFVGNRACFDCHPNYVRGFASSPHARLRIDDTRAVGLSGCESCHGPGSKHIAAGGGRGKFIVNPGRNAAACFECHLETRAQFRLPQHHPVGEGKMNCVNCHDPHGLDIMKPAGGLAMARMDESCSQCHREQAKPAVYPHEAMREGCVTCHQPHGSVNAKMLVQPDLNLCLRCHAQVQGPGVPAGQFVIGAVNHSTFAARGSCWSSGCHTAVHGSDMNHHLLY